MGRASAGARLQRHAALRHRGRGHHQPLRLFRSGRRGYVVETLDPRPVFVNPNRMVHFINVLQGREKPHVLPEQSLAVQKILDAIYLSAATGREVRLR